MQDLRVASPATVSRCGMVFVDADELKWMPYVKTWMQGISKKVSATSCSQYLSLSGLILPLSAQNAVREGLTVPD